ncbi:MAG: SAM-dependent methyltransferase [Burkholderiales bacterium PBB5]|nr:MAG: SAM-dependent methyltransferase [Burkholderiales bacterium PBB5]
MPGYLTKQESIAIAGEDDLIIRSLLDRQQFADPLGLAEGLGISSSNWPLFGLLWPSGAHLAAHLALRPVLLGERVLEIGCGLGLASLVGHRRGADVTASDCHPLAELFLAENLRLNGLPPMKYRHGQWGKVSATAVLAGNQVLGEFDLIIGSDVLYERDADGTLADYIALHATPLAEVWIVDPDRGNRPAFNRDMAGHGFDRVEHRLTQSLPVGAGTSLSYKGRLLVYQRH